MLRAVGYVRVSTEEQAAEGISLDAQSEKVRAYCAAHGFDLAELIVVDESARSLDRPGLSRALGLLDERADVLVVAKLDRLTRDVADWCALLRSHFGADAPSPRELHTVADGRLDTRTATGRLLLNIRISIAQWERETIVERTKEALDHKRGRGDRTGGVPFGWDLDPSSPLNRFGRPTGLLPNLAEQLVIAEIRETAASGLGTRAIADALNRRGVPTKTGRAGWGHSAIAKILERTERLILPTTHPDPDPRDEPC